MNYYVYAHARNTDDRFFYIGKGKYRRAWETRGRNKHWHRVADKHGWHVVILVNHICEGTAFQIERQMIDLIGRSNLTNATDGGEGMSGFIMPDHVKAKIAAAHRGMITSDATRLKLSEYRTGTKLSDKHKEKVSDSLIGNNRRLDKAKRIFYHRSHGLFIGNMREFFKMSGEHPTRLIKQTKLHIKGWVYIGVHSTS